MSEFKPTEVYTCLYCGVEEPFDWETKSLLEPGKYEGYFQSRVTCQGCTASGPWCKPAITLKAAKSLAVSAWNDWVFKVANKTIKALEEYRDG